MNTTLKKTTLGSALLLALCAPLSAANTNNVTEEGLKNFLTQKQAIVIACMNANEAIGQYQALGAKGKAWVDAKIPGQVDALGTLATFNMTETIQELTALENYNAGQAATAINRTEATKTSVNDRLTQVNAVHTSLGTLKGALEAIEFGPLAFAKQLDAADNGGAGSTASAFPWPSIQDARFYIFSRNNFSFLVCTLIAIGGLYAFAKMCCELVRKFFLNDEHIERFAGEEGDERNQEDE